GVGEVLAHEGVVKTELVGEDDALAILLERLGPIAVHGVHRHGEVAQPHVPSPTATQPLGGGAKAADVPNLPRWHKHQFVSRPMHWSEPSTRRLREPTSSNSKIA